MSIPYCQRSTTYPAFFFKPIHRANPADKPGIRQRVCKMIVPVFVLALIVVPVCVFGQSEPEIEEGDRVRVTTDEGRETYIFQRFENHTLELLDVSADETISLPADQILRIRVSQGPRPQRIAFLRGFGFGLVIGAGLGAGVGLASGDDGPGFMSMTAGEKARLYGFYFGVLGGITGGFIRMIRPGERWERVDLNIAPTTTSSASAALTFSYQF